MPGKITAPKFFTSVHLVNCSTWAALESWKPNHWASGSNSGNDVSWKFCSQALPFDESGFTARWSYSIRRTQQTNEWWVHQVECWELQWCMRARGKRQSNVSVGENLAKPQFVACSDAVSFFLLQGSNILGRRAQKIAARGNTTCISSLGFSFYPQRCWKEVWNLERKLQIDEPISGGRQACQVCVTVWRWSVHAAHNHIPACWLQLTTLFQRKNDYHDWPLTWAKKVTSLVNSKQNYMPFFNIALRLYVNLKYIQIISSRGPTAVGTNAYICDWLQVIMFMWWVCGNKATINLALLPLKQGLSITFFITAPPFP